MALRRLAEERLGGLVLEHFQAELARERRDEIPATAALVPLQRELQNLPDISDLKAVRPLVCILPEPLDGETAHCPARESCPLLQGVEA